MYQIPLGCENYRKKRLWHMANQNLVQIKTVSGGERPLFTPKMGKASKYLTLPNI